MSTVAITILPSGESFSGNEVEEPLLPRSPVSLYLFSLAVFFPPTH